MGFPMKKGDTLPSLRDALEDNGVPVDLTSVTGVAFVYEQTHDESGAAMNGPAVIRTGSVVAPATSGLVQYDWVAGDTSTPGRFRYEWRLTYSGGKSTTYPPQGFRTFEVYRGVE